MPRAHHRWEERHLASLPEPVAVRRSLAERRARAHLVLGYCAILALLVAFAETCWHAQTHITPSEAPPVLPIRQR